MPMPSLAEYIADASRNVLPDASHSLSLQERILVRNRMVKDAIEQLSVGPIYVLAGGVGSLLAVGALEGAHFVTKPSPYFVARYSIAQLLPSLIWHTAPASAIAHVSLQADTIANLLRPSLSLRAQLRVGRLQALRGAIASSIVLTQMLSLSHLLQDARTSYANRVAQGKASPLDSNASHPVIIRLAGKESAVTEYSRRKLGCGRLWGIYEEHQLPPVQGNDKDTSLMPFYWYIPSGKYSDWRRWKGMSIPESWAFTRNDETTGPSKCLVVEGDATAGDGSSLSLSTQTESQLDFDLYEAAQAFRKIEGLAPKGCSLLRILLVDAQLAIVSGGGRSTTIKELARLLDLADVVIDSRCLISAALASWLDGHFSVNSSGKRKVALETPEREWFISLKTELAKYGYEVVDLAEGLGDTKCPVLVYGRTSSNTVYTIEALYKMLGKDRPMCAMLTDDADVGSLPKHVDHICSSQIYHAAFSYARENLLAGQSSDDVQKEFDQVASQ